jgi:hypothetical protein
MRNIVLLVLAVSLLTSGCFTLNYSSSASTKPIAFTGEVKGQRTHFSEEKWIWFALWGLVPISDNDIEKSLIEPRTASGAVQNLSVKSEFTALNWLANVFTCIASICAKTVTVEGDVVR